MKNDIDLVLINANSRKQVYQSLGAELAAVEPPIWCGLYASYAMAKGLTVQILDAEAMGWTHEQTAKEAAALRTALCAVVVYGHQPSASTQNLPAAIGVCEALKKNDPAMKLLIVGGHVAALPERTLDESGADFACSGEGLHTVVELTQALKAGGKQLDKVHDLVYREGAGVVKTASAPLVTDLDREVPGIPWHMLPMDKYRAHNWHAFDDLKRQPYAAIYTTLGCPYHCSFCCIQAPFKSGEKAAGMKETLNSYRFWSPQFILSQLELLSTKYGVRHVKIADEMFVLNARHVEGICKGVADAGWDLNFWAYARVDTVRGEGQVELLKKGGVNWLAFGIEAANAKVRDNVQKGFDQEDIARTVDMVRKGGIYVIGNYIFGLPEDDLSTMQETLDLAVALNCEFANFYCTMAYPGSDLYDLALKEHWALPKTWSGYSQHAVDTLPLPTRHLTAGQVLKFRDQAFHTYYTNPKYLEMIERKFGAKTAQHVREMTAHKLERQFAAA